MSDENQENKSEVEEVPQDLECVLCLRLLLDPISVSCGHTFCRCCLERSLDYRSQCPMCRQPIVAGQNVNVVIQQIISEKYPKTLAERKKERENEALNDKDNEGLVIGWGSEQWGGSSSSSPTGSAGHANVNGNPLIYGRQGQGTGLLGQSGAGGASGSGSGVKIDKRNVPLLELDSWVFHDDAMYRNIIFPGVRVKVCSDHDKRNYGYLMRIEDKYDDPLESTKMVLELK